MALLHLYLTILCVFVVADTSPNRTWHATETCKGYRLPSPKLSTCILKTVHGILCDSSNRNLSTIPKPYPAGLYNADFSHNKIVSLGNDSFGGCSMLRVLDLSYNRISAIDDSCFEPSPNLNILLLMHNEIIFSNPTNLLQNNQYLHNLYIDHNGLWMNGSQVFHNKTKLRIASMDTTSDLEFDNNFSELKSLRRLYLYGELRYVTNKTFEPFGKLGWFTDLRFVGDQLERVDEMGFSHLNKLRFLHLKDNTRLGFKGVQTLAYGLKYTSIVQLQISNISQAYKNQIESDYFEPFQNISKLSIIDMSSNHITMIDFLDMCKNIPNLSSLDLKFNVISEVKHIEALANCNKLQHLNAGFRLTQTNPIRQLHFKSLHVPPSLQTLILENALTVRRIKELTLYGGNKLQKINMGNNGLQDIVGPVRLSYPCTSNINVDLSMNEISHIDYGAIHDSLSKCVHFLSLVGNKLGTYFVHLRSDFFLNFDNLKTLELSLNKITSMRYDLFLHLRKLTKLNLGRNLITSLNYIGSLVSLSDLDIHANNFAYLSKEEMMSIDLAGKRSKAHFHLELYKNPLICTCESLQFLKWLLKHAESVTGWSTNRCKDVDKITFNTSLASVIIPELNSRCYLKLWLTIGSSSVGVVLIMTVTFICIYRKRWHLRYWCIKSARARKRYQYLQDTESFMYDAFVMYSSDDIQWVVNELVPHLETENESGEVDQTQTALTLCLHHRDFIGGNFITDNIVEAIDNSRKCILVLSCSFCKGEWTQFEMQMARARAISERRNIIVVIRLEEVPFNEISNTLFDILKTQTYIEYLGAEQDREAFWTRVKKAVKEPC